MRFIYLLPVIFFCSNSIAADKCAKEGFAWSTLPSGKLCCEGLTPTFQSLVDQKNCTAPIPDESGNCVVCGDGKCDVKNYESKCVCPEDCKDGATSTASNETGSICIGHNLSKDLKNKELLQIDDGEKFEIGDSAKVIALNLDLSQHHKATVYNSDGKTVRTWKFRIENPKSKMVTIFRGAGDWHTVQNKVGICEFPIEGCKFKSACK